MPEHDFHLFLHTSKPPSSWPSHLEKVSPLLKKLKEETNQSNGLVNFAYTAPGHQAPNEIWTPEVSWDKAEPESYQATLYGRNQFEAFAPSVSLSNYRSIIQKCTTDTLPAQLPKNPDALRFYVCTHGNRDCRCGDVGADVVDALREAVSNLGAFARESIRISEVGHVGGHVWAANVLVYPYGDWLGNIRPSDVPAILKWYMSGASAEGSGNHLMRSHRRGKMGISMEAELAWHRAPVEPTTEFSGLPTPLARKAPSTPTWSIPFTGYDGNRISVPAKEGNNLMKIAKAAGVPSIEGVCDGKLECATCHVYIPPRAADSVPAPIPAISCSEEDMLEYAIGRRDESRLGCQVRVTKELIEWLQGGGELKLPRF